MEIETDEEGRTVLRSSDINELIGYLKGRDKREVEFFRPVLVVTIDNPVRNGGRQREGVAFGDALAGSIALGGYPAGNANRTDQTDDLHRFDFDRHLQLNSIPFVSEPTFDTHYLFNQIDDNGIDDGNKKRIVGVHIEERPNEELIRETVKVLVIASHDLTDTYIAKTLRPWDGVSYDELPIVIHHGPSGGTFVSLDRIQAARARFTAETRFLYNHAVNFSGLARRALFKICCDERVSKQAARSAIPSAGTYRWRWAHPFFLQLLHYLKRIGRVGTEQHRIQLTKKVNPFAFAHVYAKGLPIFQETKEGYEWVWQGTGAFPECRLDVGRVPEPSEDNSVAIFLHPVFETFQHIEHVGLLGLDGDQIVLSPWGLKFLDIMGPETEDPDVLLRWRTATGEICGPEDTLSTDSWLRRVFGSARSRIEAFKEELALYDVEDCLVEASPSNQLSLIGIRIPLDDNDFADPEIAAEIALIAESEKRIPIAQRYYGLVHESERLDGGSKISGIWIGVPLAVAYANAYADPLSREPGWLRKLDAERAEAAEAIRTATPRIKHRAEGLAIEVIHGLPLAENTGILRELPWDIEASEGDILRPIILGVTSTVDKVSPVTEALKRRLMMGSASKVPEPDYYDGIHQYSTKESDLTTVACGYFVGIYNETKDTFVVNRELHPGRVESFEDRKEFAMANLSAFFAVDRTPQGYWAILSDGTTKRINPAVQA